MVCPYCRTNNNDGSRFCINCGKELTLSDLGSNTKFGQYPKMNASTKLVQAKCTNCGAALTVNPSEDAAICPFCNSAFIVDKAIQNFTSYNISANNVEIHNVKQDNEWTYKAEQEKQKVMNNDKLYDYKEKRNEHIETIICLIISVIFCIVMYYYLYKLH